MKLLLRLLIGLTLCLTVCAYAQQRADAPAGGADSLAAKAVALDYQIAPEDVLGISVWKEDGLNKEVLVCPDGRISFPLAGDMQASGKTAQQLEEEITLRLTKCIAHPVVSVTVLKVMGNKIYVMGKVNRPENIWLAVPSTSCRRSAWPAV